MDDKNSTYLGKRTFTHATNTNFHRTNHIAATRKPACLKHHKKKVCGNPPYNSLFFLIVQIKIINDLGGCWRDLNAIDHVLSRLLQGLMFWIRTLSRQEAVTVRKQQISHRKSRPKVNKRTYAYTVQISLL